MPTLADLDALIFDVDGVLVRSMERHFDAYRETFAARGYSLEAHEVYSNEGRGSRDVIEQLAGARNLSLSSAQLDTWARDKQEAFLSYGPQPLYPGVDELLTRAHAKGLRLAAVTGTYRANVDNHLGPLVERFEVVVSADDVKRTKPDPEPYETAVRYLGVDKARALVVENATLGVRSAKAAGLSVVAILSTLPKEDLPEADYHLGSIAQLWAALGGEA